MTRLTGTAAAHVLVFDGYADWEPAHALAELRRTGGIEVLSVGFTANPIRSMGGLRVIPDTVLECVEPDAVRILILPGGDMWEGAYPTERLHALLGTLEARGTPVAAICGATLGAARAGLLRARRHTSNAPGYLTKHVPGYGDLAQYADALAVRDRGVITASGLGCLEFAREIFEETGVFSDAVRPVWYDVFKTGRLPTAAP